MDDEREIRDLIERWVAAVHTGDLDAVLADHTDDIVMYDVPPPYDGVRGIDAYRETWPPFFEWQASGAVFELESLDVTAGVDVAFAYALLRCGARADFAANPKQRLRLTFGLVKSEGRWTVAHEHHSFPHSEDPTATDEVRGLQERWYERTAAGDLDGLMSDIAGDVVSYEHAGPLAYIGVDQVREVCRAGLEHADGAIEWECRDLTVLRRGDLAVSWGIDHQSGETSHGEFETRSRATRVFRHDGERWLLVHQHNSYPLPAET